MLSFRQKIIITYLAAFVVFLILLFPFALHTVKALIFRAMEKRSTILIEKIQHAPNNDALVRVLKDQRPEIFFRVSIITNEHKVLYDSLTKHLLGPRFSQEFIVEHPEVVEAFKNGVGYVEGYSKLLNQNFAYMAKTFDFHGKTYVLRTAFPYQYVEELTRDFQTGFLGLSTMVLLLFSIMTWLIINNLTRPIQTIINAVRPYQEGLQTDLPEIKMEVMNPNDDFGKLASTLNSLSEKIQKQIDILTLERNEKEAVLESLVEGVIAVDGQMIVTFANRMALKMLGFRKESLVGQHFDVIAQQQCSYLLSECQKEKKELTDTIFIRNESGRLFVDITACPILKNIGAILVLQDKTSHYKMLEMRKDFIANASHELKTPITIIRGFAETLHDTPDLPKPLFEEITGKIVRNCKRMTTLIKDLLALTDIEHSTSSRLVDCDLHDIIQNCCHMVQEVHRDANIEIKLLTDREMHLLADPNLMEMAFMNLIENGAKYSNPPAHITITMDLNDKNMTISVADKGIGIPDADQENIFQRFYTVNKARSRKLGGSGLGLSIVETVIEKHQGTISVKSQLDVGTTFTIVLPIRSSES